MLWINLLYLDKHLLWIRRKVTQFNTKIPVLIKNASLNLLLTVRIQIFGDIFSRKKLSLKVSPYSIYILTVRIGSFIHSPITNII